MVQEPQRVQHADRPLQLLLAGGRQHLAEEQTLQRRFGRIIDATWPSAVGGDGLQCTWRAETR
jgi:hypothetical protein